MATKYRHLTINYIADYSILKRIKNPYVSDKYKKFRWDCQTIINDYFDEFVTAKIN